MLLIALAPLLALQSAPAAAAPLNSFDDLPIEQAAAPRCGVAFAIVGKWQREGDARGNAYPNMEAEGGREFFVRSMADLMDARSLSREAVLAIVNREVAALDTPQGAERVEAMMPACLLMKQSSGL